jgi:predicted ArsR family transcriptional regulator
MLYELFAADRQDNLHTDLKLLLDLMTPLYKARTENLADQPRKLLAHMMEHWAPVAAAELAEASDIPTTTVSGQLARLEAEGLIEKAKLPGRRRAGYQVAERFFNIWYLMRYTPRRIREGLTWLVEFMRLWYSSDELRALAGERARAHAENVSDPNDPYPAANHTRLLVLMDKRAEAGEAFRQAIELAARVTKPEGSEDYWDILLQAHLWLGNQDSSGQALEQLATRASSNGDTLALYRLRQQARECHGIGLGPALAELMAQSAHASFLKPIALGLRAASGEAEALDGIPPELRTMAEEVMRDVLAQDRKAVGG